MAKRTKISGARTPGEFREAVVNRWRKIWNPSRGEGERVTAEPIDEVPREIYAAPNRDPFKFLGGRDPMSSTDRRFLPPPDDEEGD